MSEPEKPPEPSAVAMAWVAEHLTAMEIARKGDVMARALDAFALDRTAALTAERDAIATRHDEMYANLQHEVYIGDKAREERNAAEARAEAAVKERDALRLVVANQGQRIDRLYASIPDDD